MNTFLNDNDSIDNLVINKKNAINTKIRNDMILFLNRFKQDYSFNNIKKVF